MAAPTAQTQPPTQDLEADPAQVQVQLERFETPGGTYELDPDGEIFFSVHSMPDELPALENLTDWQLAAYCKYKAQAVPGAAPIPLAKEVRNTAVVRLRCSAKHLTLACPYFSRMRRSSFREGTELKERGCLELDTDVYPAEGMAFFILMLILHGRSNLIPQRLSLWTLSDMAVLVDYYECYNQVAVFWGKWIAALNGTSSKEDFLEKLGKVPDVKEGTKALLRVLLVSWTFGHAVWFEAASRHIVWQSNGIVGGENLPIPGLIIDKINESRKSHILSFHRVLGDVWNQVRSGCLQRKNPFTQGGPDPEAERCSNVVLEAISRAVCVSRRNQMGSRESRAMGMQLGKEYADVVKRSPLQLEIGIAHEECCFFNRAKTGLVEWTEWKGSGGLDIDDAEIKQLRGG